MTPSRKEFREREERRSRVAGMSHFTPYRCGHRMTQEEEGWLQCNACIAADRESPETDRTISVFEELQEEFQRKTERSVDRWAAGLDRQQAEQQQQLQEEQHLSGRRPEVGAECRCGGCKAEWLQQGWKCRVFEELEEEFQWRTARPVDR